MHILITRFSSLGDVVIQTGFINSLKASYPKLRVSFLTLSPFVSLLENHPNIDKVYGHQKHSGLRDIKYLKEIGKSINSENEIDFIIDLHSTTRSFLFKTIFCSIPSFNIDKRRIERFCTINLKIDLLKNTKLHQHRLAYDIFKLIGIRAEDSQTSLGLISDPVDKKYIVLAPIASFAPKRWPIDSYNNLIQLILEDDKLSDLDIKILAGPDDTYVDEIIDHPRVENLRGKTTLEQSSIIIKESIAVVGNDTGMGHIAEAFNIPSIVLFGPTHPSLGFAPYKKGSFAVTENIWCSPCSGTGKKKCFRKEQYCFSKLLPETVFSKIKEIL